MNSFYKIFVALSMLCYIATSSIAAVHAFPMMDSSQGLPTVAGKSIGVDTDKNKGGASDTLMPCHKVSDSSADSLNASNACKIFCSAIGHALLSMDSTEVVSTLRHTSPHSRIDRLSTAQISVEHQPPK